MSILKKYIEEDLKSLYKNNYVENAKLLNEQMGADLFCENMLPGYFCGDEKAKTVMVMLNPGAEDKDFSFSKTAKQNFEDMHEFINKFINDSINYGENDIERQDNFDLKQAAFLHYFENTGINIQEYFWTLDNGSKLTAKRNVLMQKLQLELVPYPSRKFEGMFDSVKHAVNNFKFIEQHINRLLNVITEYDRNYVIFASKNFQQIFKAMEKLGYEVEVGKEESVSGIMKNKLYAITVKIKHNDKEIKGIIARSFPNQALPNAYEKMSKYGKFCYELSKLPLRKL
jgi:ribosomal protein S8